MSDEVQEQQTNEQPDTGTPGEPDWKTEAEKWKGLSRKHEQQAKANADAAKRLAEIEEAQKSEAQKAADKEAERTKQLTTAQQELMRLRVAMRKGLTETQAKRLIGDTEEALETDADELLASFKHEETERKEGGKPAERPKEKLKSGSTASDGEPPQLTREDLKKMTPEQIQAAKEKGQLKTLLRQ